MARKLVSALVWSAAVSVVLVAVALAVVVYLERDLVVGGLTIRWQDVGSVPLPVSADQVPVELARPEPSWSVEGGRPRNVVIFIGDGMGVGAVSAGSVLLHGPEGGLAVEDAPVVGLMRTWSASDLVTDSAASATALATGYKTINRRLSQLPDGRPVRTVLEAARAAGLGTGVVTTTGLFDATPAGFSTHAAHRRQYHDVFRGMMASGVDVMLGGDWADKDSRWGERFGLDAGLELARSAGYTVVRDPSALDAVTEGPVLGLFPAREPGGDAHGPPLRESVEHALRLLQRWPGFVLLVESEETDETAHDNDIGALLDGLEELDAAVRWVLDEAAVRGDTLVVVTADHDTGGLGIDGAAYGDGSARVRWATGDHTHQWVPVFAFGPGCERFGRMLDNTDVAWVLGELLELPDFPAIVGAGDVRHDEGSADPPVAPSH
jgi:alkaline phosphatase